ncbi:MAG: 2-amino-4-hydroxy-6-hydroxymethyldihydropteridine diphosphokinase [Rhodoferax sp.]
MRDAVRAYIGLGANLGDAAQTLRQALEGLQRSANVELVTVSALYCSAPVDAQGPDFTNAVAAVDTTLSAPDLLALLLALEARAGRERPYRNAPRTLDLDLLLYGDATIASPALTVPHPRMQERAFVLVPMAEIAPERVLQATLEAVASQRLLRLP